MKQIKKYKATKFFNKRFPFAAWKRGKQIYLEVTHQIVPSHILNGKYETTLVNTGFYVPSTGRGLSVFEFQLPDKSYVMKSIGVESSEGIASLMWEMAKFGINIEFPVDLDLAYDQLNKYKPTVIINIYSLGAIRFIDIVQCTTSIPKEEIKEEIVPEKTIEPPIVPEEKPEEKAPEPINAIPTINVVDKPTASNEVDIMPGHKIIVDLEDKGKTIATVLKTFEEERELAVQLEDGSKLIVSVDTIAEFIG